MYYFGNAVLAFVCFEYIENLEKWSDHVVLHSLGGPDQLPQPYSFHMHNLPLCAGGMKGANGFVFPNLDTSEAAKLVWGKCRGPTSGSFTRWTDTDWVFSGLTRIPGSASLSARCPAEPPSPNWLNGINNSSCLKGYCGDQMRSCTEEAAQAWYEPGAQ